MYNSTLPSTSAIDGGGWSTPLPGRFTPGKTRYPLYRRLGGPQGRSGRVRKISPPSAFDPRTVQSVAVMATKLKSGNPPPAPQKRTFYWSNATLRCTIFTDKLSSQNINKIQFFFSSNTNTKMNSRTLRVHRPLFNSHCSIRYTF